MQTLNNSFSFNESGCDTASQPSPRFTPNFLHYQQSLLKQSSPNLSSYFSKNSIHIPQTSIIQIDTLDLPLNKSLKSLYNTGICITNSPTLYQIILISLLHHFYSLKTNTKRLMDWKLMFYSDEFKKEIEEILMVNKRQRGNLLQVDDKSYEEFKGGLTRVWRMLEEETKGKSEYLAYIGMLDLMNGNPGMGGYLVIALRALVGKLAREYKMELEEYSVKEMGEEPEIDVLDIVTEFFGVAVNVFYVEEGFLREESFQGEGEREGEEGGAVINVLANLGGREGLFRYTYLANVCVEEVKSGEEKQEGAVGIEENRSFGGEKSFGGVQERKTVEDLPRQEEIKNEDKRDKNEWAKQQHSKEQPLLQINQKDQYQINNPIIPSSPHQQPQPLQQSKSLDQLPLQNPTKFFHPLSQSHSQQNHLQNNQQQKYILITEAKIPPFPQYPLQPQYTNQLHDHFQDQVNIDFSLHTTEHLRQPHQLSQHYFEEADRIRIVTPPQFFNSNSSAGELKEIVQLRQSHEQIKKNQQEIFPEIQEIKIEDQQEFPKIIESQPSPTNSPSPSFPTAYHPFPSKQPLSIKKLQIKSLIEPTQQQQPNQKTKRKTRKIRNPNLNPRRMKEMFEQTMRRIKRESDYVFQKGEYLIEKVEIMTREDKTKWNKLSVEKLGDVKVNNVVSQN